MSPNSPLLFEGKFDVFPPASKSGILDIMISMGKDVIEKLLAEFRGKFSCELGIDLPGNRPAELFKWFLAAKLFGARISMEIAARTYREFERRGVVTPEGIQASGWDGLVAILDAGGYVRYDFSTATRLLAITETLTMSYGGDLTALHEQSRDSSDLERRLKALGPGVGDVTVNIFLRELRTTWPKARPALSPLALLAARHLDLVELGEAAPLVVLETLWSRYPVNGRDFCDFEAGLVRLGMNHCRKERHEACPFRDICGKRRIVGD